MRVPSIIFFGILVAVVNGQNRKLNYTVNPGCPDTCDGLLVHVMGEGTNDTVHHIWDFSKGRPSFILALTQPNNTLKINWTEFLKSGTAGSVQFDTDPSYVFAVALDKIIEFDDVENLGYYKPDSKFNKTEISGEGLEWKMNRIKGNNEEIEAEFHISNVGIGNPSITLRAFGNKDHTKEQPHILHTSNATVIDVVLDKMTTHYNNSRFAINLLLFSTNSVDTLPQIKRSSTDDEHSPGVFTTGEIFTTNDGAKDFTGYVQWKTIAYTSPDLIHAQSTNVNDLKASRISNPLATFNNSAIYALVGDAVIGQTPSHSVVVSFGAKDDGFYAKKSYTSFSFAVGVGEPAEETFSLLVTLILSIGLGVPALLVIVASVCIIARRVSRTRDELFLTQ